LWEAGHTPEVLAVFQDLLQRHPEHLDVRDSLVHVYEEIGQDDRAAGQIRAIARSSYGPLRKAGCW
jgi:hypothetical protein